MTFMPQNMPSDDNGEEGQRYVATLTPARTLIGWIAMCGIAGPAGCTVKNHACVNIILF